MKAGLGRWHQVVQERDLAMLTELLSPDAVFLSPVLHRPVVGRDTVVMYLAGAMHVLGVGQGFRYVREVAAGDTAVLEFEADLDGLLVNGVDMIRFDAEDRIVEFKVMLRPLSATLAVKEAMAALLAAAPGGAADPRVAGQR